MTQMIRSFRVSKQMSVVATGAIFCCATAFGQMAPSTGSMQQSAPAQSTSPNTMQNGSTGSMNQMQTVNDGSMGSTMADKMFLKKALQGSMAEVQLGQLALNKSSNDQVKQFAQRMIDDHSRLIDQTKPVAMQMGVEIPSGPDKKEKAKMAKLQALSGDAFDKAYIKDMVKDHKMDDNDFKSEISSAQNPQVKELAAKGDPIIESHLQMVEQIAKSMNISSGE